MAGGPNPMPWRPPGRTPDVFKMQCHAVRTRAARRRPGGLPSRLAAGVASGKLRIRGPLFSPPKLSGSWQQKNAKTYAHGGCEQLGRKLALKWFFGSQLLRPSSVLLRFATVLFHAFDDPRAYPAATPSIDLSTPDTCESPLLSLARLMPEPRFCCRESTLGNPTDMPKTTAAGAV